MRTTMAFHFRYKDAGERCGSGQGGRNPYGEKVPPWVEGGLETPGCGVKRKRLEGFRVLF